MAKLGVVLDACVLFPMYLRDVLLCTAEAGLYIPYWSQKILDEAMGNLVSAGKISAEKAMSLEEIMKAAFPEAMVEVPVGLEQLMRNDPKDRHVLAAAVKADADVIVTDNIADFPTAALAYWNIKAQTPDEFLSDLFDETPESIVQVLRRQSGKYRNPKKTVADLLDFLDRKANLSKFASQVLFYQYSREVLQTAKKALSQRGIPAADGSRFLEDERYRLWQQEQTLTIAAKDGRGEILRQQDEKIEGNLSAEDVRAFQLLEQELAQPEEQQPESDDSPGSNRLL
ncbi:PIN domain-containing protein [Kamptonema formosum]|uniref:PIN domain-containing protein n=1 Tax=Kamptonema formosum TaxID=331992 RepID=UPI00037A07AC|nr:PIN domain-containing protein [Oscillatoria sp. PCC 10802]